jgi:hypothetical protein
MKSTQVKKTRMADKPLSAEAIARLADRGKDISGFFEGKGRMVQPLLRQPLDQHYLAQQAKPSQHSKR